MPADRLVDIVGENFDIAIHAHFGSAARFEPRPADARPAPWFLFAGSGLSRPSNGDPESAPGPPGSSLALHDEDRASTPVWRSVPPAKCSRRMNSCMPLTPEVVER